MVGRFFNNIKWEIIILQGREVFSGRRDAINEQSLRHTLGNESNYIETKSLS